VGVVVSSRRDELNWLCGLIVCVLCLLGYIGLVTLAIGLDFTACVPIISEYLLGFAY
jgi:hypothetical protein